MIFPVSDNAEDVFVKMAHHIADMLENHKGYATSLVITFIGIEASDISAEMEAAAKQVYQRWIQLYCDKPDCLRIQPGTGSADRSADLCADPRHDAFLLDPQRHFGNVGTGTGDPRAASVRTFLCEDRQ